MSYYLHAFIGRRDDMYQIQKIYNLAAVRELGQDIYLIPMTQQLFAQINNFAVIENIEPYDYLTTNVENEILEHIGNRTIAYIEVDYWDNSGGQVGIIWKDKQRLFNYQMGHNVVNEVLKFFGVIANPDQDEFDTLDLGRYRKTERWL
ncbi:MAG: hypothetical protein HY738_05075 [Bacteroidia bacterium]|nr:hypothetical protein [Bacteroidia bacterium]